MITGRPFTQVNSIDDGEVAVHILPRVSWDTSATGIKLLEQLSISSKNLVLALSLRVNQLSEPMTNQRCRVCTYGYEFFISNGLELQHNMHNNLRDY